MPNNYVEVTEDEMMYVDGGARTREFRFKNSHVVTGINVSVAVTGGTMGAVKWGLKKLGIILTSKQSIVVAGLLALSSPGKHIANFLDRDNDGYVEGYRNHYKGSSGLGWLSIE